MLQYSQRLTRMRPSCCCRVQKSCKSKEEGEKEVCCEGMYAANYIT